MNQTPDAPMTPGDERLAKVNPHAMDVMQQPEGQKMVSDVRSTVRESMTRDYMQALQSILSGKEFVSGNSDRGQVSIAKLSAGAVAVTSNNGIAVEEFVVQAGMSPIGIRYTGTQGEDGEGTTVSSEGLDTILKSFQPAK